MKKQHNIPAIVIGLSIPFMWILVFVLAYLGFFNWLDTLNISEFTATAIIVLIANIPVLIFIGYGLYNAVNSPSTIPKVKERMPWDKGNPLAVDTEWREKIKKENK